MTNNTRDEIYIKLQDDMKSKLMRYRKMTLNKFKNDISVNIDTYKKPYNSRQTILHVRKTNFTIERLLKLMINYQMSSVVGKLRINKSISKSIFILLTSVHFTNKIKSPVFREDLEEEKELQNNFIFKYSQWDKIKYILFYDSICPNLLTASVVALGINNKKQKFRFNINENEKKVFLQYGFTNHTNQQQSQQLPSAILIEPKTIRYTNKIPYHLQTNLSARYNPRSHATDGDEQSIEELRNQILNKPQTIRIISTSNAQNMMNNENTNDTPNMTNNQNTNDTQMDVEEINNYDSGISIACGIHITQSNEYTKLLSTPNEYIIKICSWKVKNVLNIVVSLTTWHQHDCTFATNVCGGAAPVIASICNRDSGVATKCVLDFVDQLLFQNEINENSQISSNMEQQLAIGETLMKELNDGSHMRRKLNEIKLQIEEHNLNPLNENIKHPLQDLQIEAVLDIINEIESNEELTSLNTLIVQNVHQIEECLKQGVIHEIIDDVVSELHRQIEEDKITHCFLIQLPNHYFSAILKKCSDEKFMWINADTLNPAESRLRDRDERPFGVLLNIISKYNTLQSREQHLCMLELFNKLQTRINRLLHVRRDCIENIAKIFRHVISFKTFKSDYYDGQFDDKFLDDVAGRIMDDLETRTVLDINQLQRNRNLDIHIENVSFYLYSLQVDTEKDFNAILIAYELNMFKETTKYDLPHIIDLNKSNANWNISIAQSIHLYHTFIDLLNNNNMLDGLKKDIMHLDQMLDTTIDKLFDELFQNDNECVFAEITCESCFTIVNDNNN
eukprot:114356_1